MSGRALRKLPWGGAPRVGWRDRGVSRDGRADPSVAAADGRQVARWTSVGFIRPHSAVGAVSEGQRVEWDRSRLAHPNGDDQPRAGGQAATTRIATLASNRRRAPRRGSHRSRTRGRARSGRCRSPRAVGARRRRRRRRAASGRPSRFRCPGRSPPPATARTRTTPPSPDRSRLEQHPGHDQALRPTASDSPPVTIWTTPHVAG